MLATDPPSPDFSSCHGSYERWPRATVYIALSVILVLGAEYPPVPAWDWLEDVRHITALCLTLVLPVFHRDHKAFAYGYDLDYLL